MAEDITALILKNVLTTLESVSSINAVGLGTFLTTDKPRPHAGIIPGDDFGNLSAPAVRESTLPVTIRLVADQEDEEAVYKLIEARKDVHAALIVDRSRGGYAQDTRYLGTHWLFVDQREPQAGGDMLWEIDYKTKHTDLTAQP